jgi:hypothetical protein
MPYVLEAFWARKRSEEGKMVNARLMDIFVGLGGDDGR